MIFVSIATSGERSAVTADRHSSWSRRAYWQSADLGGACPERRQQLVLSAPAVHGLLYNIRSPWAVTQHPAITTNRRSVNPGCCCIHRQSSWLLQRRSVRRLHKSSVDFRWFWTLLPVWSSVLADMNTSRRPFATCFIGSQFHGEYSSK